MPTSVISHTVTDLNGTPLAGVSVIVRLIAEASTAFRISDASELAPVESFETNESGQVSMALEETANITPNSFYRVFVDRPTILGGPSYHTIQVGADNATLYESIVSSPLSEEDYRLFLTQEIGDARYSRIGDSGFSSDWLSWNVAHSAMTAAISGISSGCAQYDAASDRTYIVYGGSMRRPTVTYWDHTTETVGPTVELGDYDDAISFEDAHGGAALCVDSAGTIHVMWAAHNSAIRYARSNSPATLDDGFTAVTEPAGVPIGTYVSLVAIGTTLYAWYRTGSAHGEVYPCHEIATLIRSIDGGDTWTDLAPVNGIQDLRNHPDAAADMYPIGGMRVYNGKLYMCWHIAHGAGHDGTRGNIYVAYYDPADGFMHELDGTSLGASINWTEHAQVLAYSKDSAGTPVIINVNVPTFEIGANGDILVIFNEYLTTTIGVSTLYWDGATWDHNDTGARKAFPYTPSTVRQLENGDWEAFVLAAGEGEAFDDLCLYTTSTGTAWTFDRVLVSRFDIGVSGIQGAIVPRNSHESLKCIWQPGGVDVSTPCYPLWALSDTGINAGHLALAFHPRQVRNTERCVLRLVSTGIDGEGLADSYTRADGAVGNAETGQTPVQIGTTFNVLNHRVKANGAITGGGAILLYDTELAGDGKYQAEVVPDAAWGAAVVCNGSLDGNNFLMAHLGNNSGTAADEIQLWKRDGGTFTQLAAAGFSWDSATTYEIRIERDGADVEIFIDEVSVLTFTLTGDDPAQYAALTYAGFRFYNSVASRGDAIYCTNLAGDPPSGVTMGSWVLEDVSTMGLNLREVCVILQATPEGASGEGIVIFLRAANSSRSDDTKSFFVDGGPGQWSDALWITITDRTNPEIEWFATGTAEVGALNVYVAGARS